MGTNIRNLENKLFSEWSKKYLDLQKTFTIDGCPNPQVYENEDRKIVFVLKDGNLGKLNTAEKYDQRSELESKPHKWWGTIAKWCYFIGKINATWQEAKKAICSQESIKDALSHHCFIQLKKEGGVGSVENKQLEEAIDQDKKEILRQLSFYTPDFIISCGNGDIVCKLFGNLKGDRLETSNGIGYWEISINDKACYLIDYCHPSIRAGTKIKGLIAKGLSMTIAEIENKNHNKKPHS